MRAAFSAAALGLLLVTSCAKIFGVDDPGIESDGGAGQPCDTSSNDQTPCAPGFVCLPTFKYGQGNVCSPQCSADSQCPPGQGCLAIVPNGPGNNMPVLACAPNACNGGGCNNGGGNNTCSNGVCRNTCGSGNMGGFSALGCPSDETCVLTCPMCSTGTCQPGDGGSGSSSGSNGDGSVGTPQILAMGQSGPAFIAVSDPYVFWTLNAGSGQVAACDTTGGNCGTSQYHLPLAIQQPMGIAMIAAPTPGTIAAVWADQGGAAVDLCNGFSASTGNQCLPIMMLATGRSSPVGIAIDKQGVYWTEGHGGSQGRGGVYKCSPIGADGGPSACTPQDLGAGSLADFPAMVEVDSGIVFWANAFASGGSVEAEACSTSGCASLQNSLAGSALAPNGIQGIAVDGSYFWFTISGGQKAMQEPRTGGSAMAIGTTAQQGPMSNAGSQQFVPAGIRSDGTNVYWASLGTKQIVYCPVQSCPGGTPQPLAPLNDGSSGVSLALDASYVYWVDRSAGIVARIAKP